LIASAKLGHEIDRSDRRAFLRLPSNQLTLLAPEVSLVYVKSSEAFLTVGQDREPDHVQPVWIL
jgi:hypothetical protein